MDGLAKTFVFSRPMLAAWATCCIFFGVSISLFGVDQGWITFVKPPSKKVSEEAADVTAADKEEVDQETYDRITDSLLQTDAAKSCLENPDEWKRVPYFWTRGRGQKSSALVPGTLYGPDKLTVEPVIFLNRDRKQFVVILHIGKRLCGHDGIVHGGVQATLFDEITARPAFWNLPRNIALTATLNINYRRPVLADQILVFRTQLKTIEGRKATIAAQLEDTQGNLLSDAESLYVSPSNDKLLPDASSHLKKIESVYPGNF
ncbi:hypothetical protein LPJ73_002199 [Coemansia sp. RSA 2703]|nr:hypothetical protein LPJ73_002199 [Coemansia sp. RSA 2703]KAJ2378622.1 hypothetical protein IW150_000683 [Coemansia sp. RSA 2607]